jgi:DNA invertase Pin-like site-specific DNA recombinase
VAQEATPKNEATRPAQVIGYVRVSTTEQANEGVSIAAQRAKIEAYASLRGMPCVIFSDEGISGTKADRPGLSAALDTLQKGDTLVIYSLSRLARSTKQTLEISERMQKTGCDLASLSEQIDTSSAAGKMIFRMLAVLSEFERDQIADRTAAALAHKKTLGERVGHIPYGKRVAVDGKTLEDDDDEKATLALMFELKARGYTFTAIANHLNTNSIIKRGETNAWKRKNVTRIMKNNLHLMPLAA